MIIPLLSVGDCKLEKLTAKNTKNAKFSFFLGALGVLAVQNNNQQLSTFKRETIQLIPTKKRPWLGNARGAVGMRCVGFLPATLRP